MLTNLIFKNIFPIRGFSRCLLILFCVVLQPNKIEADTTALKYQQELDKRGISQSCPNKVSPIDGFVIAYRFVSLPVQSVDNFLPNVLVDEKIKKPYKYAKDLKVRAEQMCGRCAISLYDSIENITNKWDHAGQQLKENYGYNHIAQGLLSQSDGLAQSSSKNGHFGFYEFEKAELYKKFKENKDV